MSSVKKLVNVTLLQLITGMHSVGISMYTISWKKFQFYIYKHTDSATMKLTVLMCNH